MDVGVDLVDIARVRALARRSPRFLARVFTSQEIAYCRAHKDPWPHFAVRFAAKEAVYKALGRASLPLKSISVMRDRRGKPSVLLRGRPAASLRLSLSHGDHHAVAVCLNLP